PDESRERRTRDRHLLGCVVGKVLAGECSGVAPDGHGLRRRICGLSSSREILRSRTLLPKNRTKVLFHWCLCLRLWRLCLRLAVAQDFGPAIIPEGIECAIENRQVLVAMDEQRAAGVVDLVADADIDVLQRPGAVA